MIDVNHINRIGLKKIGKRWNLTSKDIKKVKKLHELTTHGLKTIVKLREIKNYNNLTREDLIYTLLRSEGAPQENNYLGYLGNALNSELEKRIKEYLATITPQVANLIKEKKNSTQDEQKVQLTIAIILKHITNPTMKYTIYVKSKNIEVRTTDDTDDIITKLL